MAEDLTWPALLAHWTAVAQASNALPRNAVGDRWRAAIAPIVGLQALTCALADLDRLAPDESDADEQKAGARAAAIDTAEVLVRRHSGELHALWHGEPLHAEVEAIIGDARRALTAARESGVEWLVNEESLVAEHPGELCAMLLSAGFGGDVYLPVPGTILFRGAPAAFARERSGERPEAQVVRAVKEFLVGVGKPLRVTQMRQVYRQFDFGTGKVRRDLVVPLNAGIVAGQAQLIPVIERGKMLQVHLPIPGMANLRPVPVEFATSEDVASA